MTMFTKKTLRYSFLVINPATRRIVNHSNKIQTNGDEENIILTIKKESKKPISNSVNVLMRSDTYKFPIDIYIYSCIIINQLHLRFFQFYYISGSYLKYQ